MVEWKVSKYTKGSMEPRTFEAHVAGYRLVVSRHIHYPADAWVMLCELVSMCEIQLDSKDVEDAKKEALHRMLNSVLPLVSAIQEAMR